MDQAKLTRAEVARFLGVSSTRVAYAISRKWLIPYETTHLGTELFLLEHVVNFAEQRNIKLVEAAVAG